MLELTETKVHEALENTFAHVIGGRNLIAHVTEVGDSVFMSPSRRCYKPWCAIAEWHGCSPAELCGCEKWVDSWVETTCDISQWYNTML